MTSYIVRALMTPTVGPGLGRILGRSRPPDQVVVGRTTVPEHAEQMADHAWRMPGCQRAWIETEALMESQVQW